MPSAPPESRIPIWATTRSGVICGMTKLPSEMASPRPSGPWTSAVTLRTVVERPVITPTTLPLVTGGASAVTSMAASETWKSMWTASSGAGSPRVAAARTEPDIFTLMSTESTRPRRSWSTR